MKAQTLIVLIAGLWLAAVLPSPAREWTDITGKFKVEADLVEVRGETVRLKKKSTGTVIALPIAKLSKADQEYLKSLEKPGPQSPDDNGTPTPPKAIPNDPQLAAELKTGSIVSIQVSGQPVSSVLAQIEKATGNRVRIVDDFGGDDQQVLSKRISLDLQKKTFWEAVDAVCTAAGVRFRCIDDGTLELSTERPQFDKIKMIGKPAAVGAFQVFAGYDDFFEDALIVIRSEPRIGPPQLKSYRAQITLPDGKQIDYEPDFLQGTPNILTGELKLRIDPEIPEGANKARQIKLEARLAVASGFKEFTSLPLGELIPKPVKVGKGTILVTQASTASRPYNRPTFAVELVAKGLSGALKNIVLVDTAGNRVKSFAGGRSGQDGEQNVSARFAVSKISGDPGRCRLAFEVPGEGEQTIGPLAELAPKAISAGATTLRVSRAQVNEQPDGSEDFEVTIDSDSFVPSRKQIVLVGTGMQPVEPRGENPFGSSIRLWFDPDDLPGRPESYRLRIQAPTKVTEHVLEATFNDVPLAKEE